MTANSARFFFWTHARLFVIALETLLYCFYLARENFFMLGGIVLPLLGAVPDSAIIIVSGLKPHPQKQISVGMG